MVTRAQLERMLNVDEPDYDKIASLGEEAVPYLRMIVAEADVGLSAKALHAASLIPTSRLADIVDIAAGRKEPIIRVIAASTVHKLSPEQGADVALKLLADPDASVADRAVQSVNRAQNEQILRRLNDLRGKLSDTSLGDVRGRLEERFRGR